MNISHNKYYTLSLQYENQIVSDYETDRNHSMLLCNANMNLFLK